MNPQEPNLEPDPAGTRKEPLAVASGRYLPFRRGLWIGGGLLVGAVFSVAPGNLLWWICVLVVVAVAAASRLGGLFLAAGVAAGVMTVVTLLPFEFERQRVGPLRATDVSISDLVAAGIAYTPRDDAWGSVSVRLPSVTPRRLDILEAIRSQTALEGSYYRCGTVASCLRGAAGGRIRLREKLPTVPQPTP